jgi:hypothetical protein
MCPPSTGSPKLSDDDPYKLKDYPSSSHKAIEENVTSE